MIKENYKFIIALFSILFVSQSFAQNASSQVEEFQKSITITTAVPFLRINPDARAGGMGYAGIATHPDANGIFANAAKMAFIDFRDPESGLIAESGNNFGVALTFIPWLRGIAEDVYMADLVGYYNLRNKKKPEIQQSISASLRFFSLGNIVFTDIQGERNGEGNPQEFAFDVNYARKLSKNIGVGLGIRYIYSNLGASSVSETKAGQAVGADLSMFYTTPIKIKKGLEGMDFNFGAAITNIGSKMTYTQDGVEANKDFIPSNLGLGFGLELDLDEFNQVNIYFDVNKLLVPTPDTLDVDGIAGPDYKTKSQISGLFTSFGDAPGGFKEEMSEFNIGGGVEYVYNNLFMARLGYFYEAPTKGARRFLSAGAGIKYSIFTLNAAYIIPTSKPPGPLDNTMYFSLLFDFNSGGNKKAVPSE